MIRRILLSQWWLLCWVLAPFALAQEWPNWRGPEFNGVSRESSGWKRGAWPGALVWSATADAGGSAPIVAEGKLYTMGWSADPNPHDTVTCFDAQTGRRLWSQEYPCPEYGRHSEGDKGLYSGPSACPTYDGESGLLFTLSTDGDLNCWDTKRGGQRIWGVNFHATYHVPQRPLVGTRRLRDYGYTAAPVVYGDWIIAEVGDDEGNLFAFEKRTGRRVWTSACRDPAGHTGGLVRLEVDGIPCVAVLTIHQLLVARLDPGHEGETLATFAWETDFANSIATPAVHGQSLVITSEYNQYAICRVDVTRTGAKEVWKQPYASGVCSPVIHNGHIYWCWRGLYCLDLETGKPRWRGGRFGDTASVLATQDDRLLVWADRGELVLVESAVRSPKKYTELARKSKIFEQDVWPHLVLAGGRLYCKDRAGHLKCYAAAGSPAQQ
ncbi:MAG: PQQ-binding-like beta-propeller repeat protein [Pirellulaceae bacterium]